MSGSRGPAEPTPGDGELGPEGTGGAAQPAPGSDPAGPRPSDAADRPSARDLVRKRTRSYARDETGRHHHIGAAPELQPLLGEEGMQYAQTADVQLVQRTVAQLQAQRSRVADQMGRAAEDLDFERAATLRDDLTRIDAELARRDATA